MRANPPDAAMHGYGKTDVERTLRFSLGVPHETPPPQSMGASNGNGVAADDDTNNKTDVDGETQSTTDAPAMAPADSGDASDGGSLPQRYAESPLAQVTGSPTMSLHPSSELRCGKDRGERIPTAVARMLGR